jgi:hypothetical protein
MNFHRVEEKIIDFSWRQDVEFSDSHSINLVFKGIEVQLRVRDEVFHEDNQQELNFIFHDLQSQLLGRNNQNSRSSLSTMMNLNEWRGYIFSCFRIRAIDCNLNL